VIGLNEKQTRVFKETKLRNLERRFAKLIMHPECMEQCIELKCEIDSLKRELNN
jgi:hypothetical protein